MRLPLKTTLTALCLAAGLTTLSAATTTAPAAASPALHRFEIGTTEFMLDGKPIQLRCGEIHFARVPREYWQHRLKLCRAMGLNAVCAYLFWNFHEPAPGVFNWAEERDVAEFCRLAQQEGLWVILRPGPYACAEWEMGGLPWWLLKNDNIQLRSRDPEFLKASQRWFKEVGRVLGPLQVTRGGPILMAQVENEYGFYGTDAEYMGAIREQILAAGFDIPLFQCNPTGKLKSGFRTDLFNVVNFGKDPEGAFKLLREVQPVGPLMCGEFYPGWFDTWGAPHHFGNTKGYLKDLEYMLSQRGSFSMYMAHGGTTFGLWSGTDRPFKPDTSSYDYDAPISEAGWIGDKFAQTRALFARFLAPGETIPEPPAKNPVIAISDFAATEVAPIFDNLPTPIRDERPRTFELYDQGQGMALYRTTVPAGPATTLAVKAVRDFAWIFVDGQQVGVMDRRKNRYEVNLPARAQAAQLDILVHTMGRVNFGPEVHDRKGLHAPVQLKTLNSHAAPRELTGWEIFKLDLSSAHLASLKWKAAPAKGPAFWRASFNTEKTGDTFLDVSRWGKGVAWLNGRALGRYWNIGPTQTMYMPGPWIRTGRNEIIMLDLLGPTSPTLAGQVEPVLNTLRPELDFAKTTETSAFADDAIKYQQRGTFAQGSAAQDVRFERTIEARQFCLESLSSHEEGPFAAFAELDLLDVNGQSIPHTHWTIAYVSSEEKEKEDGSALNAINGQTADFWHSQWGSAQPGHPHRLVIDLGESTRVAGFRYTPRQGGDKEAGRIKEFRAYLGDKLVTKAPVSAP